MLQKFRDIIIMSSGYALAICSTMVMYTLLPVLYTKIRGESIAGIGIMMMTFLQVFVFGPIAASLVDKYSAKKMLYAYSFFFILWAIFWLLFYGTTHPLIQTLLIVGMTVCFAAGYGSRFVDVYTLRMSPAGQSWLAFGRLVTFAWLGRFLGTLIQPHLINLNHQYIAPILMIIAMIIFIGILSLIKSDNKPTTMTTEKLHHHIRTGIEELIHKYRRTFQHGWIFIQRCKTFPLIPLSVALFEWIFFWSLWFIIPLYLSQHPEFISSGFEIGIYEIISLLCAVGMWYIADKYSSVYTSFIWWWGILLGITILYRYHSIDILITVGIIIGLSNSLLYATGQHILSEHDEDHDDDGAYGQTRNIVQNLWYMIMPVVRWVLKFIPFPHTLQIFASFLSSIVMIGVIITFYVLIMKRHTLEATSKK